MKVVYDCYFTLENVQQSRLYYFHSFKIFMIFVIDLFEYSTNLLRSILTFGIISFSF